LEDSFHKLLEVQRQEFDALFSHVAHTVSCGSIPSASINLHFVIADRSGEPAFRRLATTLVAYITQYCFSAKRRRGLSELERNKTFIEARKLFRKNSSSGQAGELLVYMFIEAVLGAPQVLKKMPIATSTNDERKGSDGVHMRWIKEQQLLEIIYAEAKLWGSFSGALADAFESMSAFHDSKTKEHEINCFSSYFPELDPELQVEVEKYVAGEELANSQQV
jgi:Cap4 SAVED domain